MGKIPKFVYVLLLLCGFCIILFLYIDSKRQLRIAFLIPDELNLRYTDSKAYLFSSIRDFFEQYGAKIEFSTLYYSKDVAVGPLIETLCNNNQPTVLYCFDDLQKLGNPPFLSEYALVISVYPISKFDLSAIQNAYPLFGTQETFFSSIQRYFEKNQITELLIIKDDASSFLSKDLSVYLRKNSAIVVSESFNDLNVFSEGSEAFFSAGIHSGIFLLCSPERVVSFLERWPGIPKKNILLGPWSLPVNSQYIDLDVLEGIIALCTFPNPNIDFSGTSPDPVFPYITGVVDSSMALLRNLYEKESGMKEKLYEIKNNDFSELLLDYRTRPKEQVWFLVEFRTDRFTATTRFDSEKSRWEKYQ